MPKLKVKSSPEATADRAELTKIQAAKKAAEARQKEQEKIKALYKKEENNPVVIDILAKAKGFALMHTTNARNGEGVVAGEVVPLTGEKRLSEMDKSAGLMELVSYIERQLT